MAVVRGWTEHSPSKILGSFIDSVLFPLPAPGNVKRVGATKCIGRLWRRVSGNLNGKLYQCQSILKDILLLHFRLLPHRGLLRGFLLESETRGESGTTEQEHYTTCRSQERGEATWGQ